MYHIFKLSFLQFFNIRLHLYMSILVLAAHYGGPGTSNISFTWGLVKAEFQAPPRGIESESTGNSYKQFTLEALL